MDYIYRHFQMYFLDKTISIPNIISFTSVHRRPINELEALVQVLAWRQAGPKPLPEPSFTDVHMRRNTSI